MAQWFMFWDEWHFRHLRHLCWLSHHDMEGGGGHRKVCRDTCHDMGKLQHLYIRSTLQDVTYHFNPIRGRNRYPTQCQTSNTFPCTNVGHLHYAMCACRDP